MVLVGYGWLRADAPAGGWRLVVRSEDGVLLHEAALSEATFALRYRNSVYGSLAEERFEVTDDGRIRLRQLAADDPAVLTEYYRLAGAPSRSPQRDGPGWIGQPEQTPELEELSLAATPLGERTLLVEGEPPVALWQLVSGGEPGLVVSVEREP